MNAQPKQEVLAPGEFGNEPPAIRTDTSSLIAMAIDKGMGAEVIGQIITYEERIHSIRARRAFDEAMADAKAEIPVVMKNKEVDFTSAKGRTHYRYEDLAEVARTVMPALAKFRLSYRFRTTSLPNEPITVTCIISHRDGHSEENSLTAGRDDSGNKNPIQQIGSTVTYLQRMTLKAALGLAASADDDGKGAADGEDASLITEAQATTLQGLLMEHDIPLPKFFKVMKIEALADLPASRFSEAEKQIQDVIALRAAKKAKPPEHPS